MKSVLQIQKKYFKPKTKEENSNRGYIIIDWESKEVYATKTHPCQLAPYQQRCTLRLEAHDPIRRWCHLFLGWGCFCLICYIGKKFQWAMSIQENQTNRKASTIKYITNTKNVSHIHACKDGHYWIIPYVIVRNGSLPQRDRKRHWWIFIWIKLFYWLRE